MAPTATTHALSSSLSFLPSLKRLLARAVYMSVKFAPLTDRAGYTANTISAVKVLQGWYSQEEGLWTTAGWWNSANCLTTLGDFAALSPGDANALGLGAVMGNTFTAAQRTPMIAVKTLSANFLVSSVYTPMKINSDRVPGDGEAPAAKLLRERGFVGFINEFYDDEGWWALGLIRAYDVTGSPAYLSQAQAIFDDMRGGWSPSHCGGGILWSKAPDRFYVNAIANELYIAVAASLANRVGPDRKAEYLDIARTQWNWFRDSGMINSAWLINDGLTPDCKNNGGHTWTYNQGVILGALVELHKGLGGADPSLLIAAGNIADAAIRTLTDANGVLHDGCEPNCGSDGNQFKGIFVRNLGYLQKVTPRENWRQFILRNADSIWAKNRNPATSQLGPQWSGPLAAVTAGTHSSALDALVAAMSVA